MDTNKAAGLGRADDPRGLTDGSDRLRRRRMTIVATMEQGISARTVKREFASVWAWPLLVGC